MSPRDDRRPQHQRYHSQQYSRSNTPVLSKPDTVHGYHKPPPPPVLRGCYKPPPPILPSNVKCQQFPVPQTSTNSPFSSLTDNAMLPSNNTPRSAPFPTLPPRQSSGTYNSSLTSSRNESPQHFGHRGIVCQSAQPCRVLLLDPETRTVQRGLEGLVPPPQFQLVPTNPPTAAKWHLKVTEDDANLLTRVTENVNACTDKSKVLAQNEITNYGNNQDRRMKNYDKPKSWDNLLSTTHEQSNINSFSGYNPGYGYIDFHASSRSICKTNTDVKSVSANKINNYDDINTQPEMKDKNLDTWEEGKCQTVPRNVRVTSSLTTSATVTGLADVCSENISPYIDSSLTNCFCCNCTEDQNQDTCCTGGRNQNSFCARTQELCCKFSRAKSSESLLTGDKRHLTTYRPRTVAIANCLRGKSTQSTVHL